MLIEGLDAEIVSFLRNNANQCSHDLKRLPAGDYPQRNDLLRQERFMRFLLGEIEAAAPDPDLIEVLRYQRDCCRRSIQAGDQVELMRKRVASYARLLLRAGSGVG